MTSDGPTRRPTVNAGAVGAGAGGGTLIAIIAQNLGPHNALRPWLLSLAPSMTIVLGLIWSYVRNLIDERMEDGRAEGILKQTQKLYEDAKVDGASHEELVYYLEKISELRKTRFTILSGRMQLPFSLR